MENIISVDSPDEKEIPSAQGMTTKVLKGSFWTLAGQVLPLMASFLSTPFIIRFLGSESYGVLILVGLILNNFSFGDFGMGMASTKFGSEAYARGSRREEGNIVRTAALIALCSASLAAIPVFIFSSAIVSDLLKVPEYLQTSASLALKITAIAFVINVLGTIFNTPQLSRLRMDLNSFITAGAKLTMALATPAVLYFGGGVVEATIVAFVTGALILGGHIFVSGKLLPELFQAKIDTSLIRPLMKFGGGVVFYGIGLIVLTNIEKLLLTRMISVQSLAYYSIAFTLANMTTMFSLAMVQSLIPAFSQLLAPEKRLELNDLFSRSLRISIVGLLPSIMVLFVIARPFFTIWAGAEFGRESVYPFYILLVGVVFSIIVYVPNCVMMAYGRPDFLAKIFWIEIIPYTLLAFFLISYFGIIGAALAWTLREVVNTFIFVAATKRIVGVSFDFFRQAANLLLGLILLLPPVLLAAFYDNFTFWLIVPVVVSAGFYSLLVWKKLVTEEERGWIGNKVRAFLRQIKLARAE